MHAVVGLLILTDLIKLVRKVRPSWLRLNRSTLAKKIRDFSQSAQVDLVGQIL